MASAEQLLNEAQYAFQRIHSGESNDNRRNASRARSLCKKIIRKFPASTEASSARAILRRLGDIAYEQKQVVQNRHSGVHPSTAAPSPATQTEGMQTGNTQSFDWNGLLTKVFNQPSGTTFIIVIALFFLFSIFGSLLLLPIFALILILGPFKSILNSDQQHKVDEWIAKINEHVRK